MDKCQRAPGSTRRLKLDRVVGADLSRTPPIHRPWLCLHDIPIKKLKCIIMVDAADIHGVIKNYATQNPANTCWQPGNWRRCAHCGTVDDYYVHPRRRKYGHTNSPSGRSRV